uniref:U6 snRNA phosphodiesterase 1 n=1 Tax=Mesocestoides corti TaxID=53468 RepID=A0A5K3F0N6_MESCO
MALVGYSSSEEEPENGEEYSTLPHFMCDLEGDMVRFGNQSRNPPTDGRLRNFPHKHGNWATSVFAPANSALENYFRSLLNDVEKVLFGSRHQFHICEDFHLSLTKTWPLLHHWIPGFTEAVRGLAAASHRFSVIFDGAQFLVNEEGTRSFLAVRVNASPNLLDVVRRLDETVVLFRGEPYYKNPVFHFSLAWCLGDVNTLTPLDWRTACLTAVNNSLGSWSPPCGLEINSLIVQCGNEKFLFQLL